MYFMCWVDYSSQSDVITLIDRSHVSICNDFGQSGSCVPVDQSFLGLSSCVKLTIVVKSTSPALLFAEFNSLRSTRYRTPTPRQHAFRQQTAHEQASRHPHVYQEVERGIHVLDMLENVQKCAQLYELDNPPPHQPPVLPGRCSPSSKLRLRVIDEETRNIFRWCEWTVMDRLPLSFVERKMTRMNAVLSPISKKTLKTYLMRVFEFTEVRVAEEQTPTFGIVLDGSTFSGRHFIAIFAVFNDPEMCSGTCLRTTPTTSKTRIATLDTSYLWPFVLSPSKKTSGLRASSI